MTGPGENTTTGPAPDAATVNRFQAERRVHPICCPDDHTPLVAYDTPGGVRLRCGRCTADVRLSKTAADLVNRTMRLPADQFIPSQET